jgi:hypothetical protein
METIGASLPRLKIQADLSRAGHMYVICTACRAISDDTIDSQKRL